VSRGEKEGELSLAKKSGNPHSAVKERMLKALLPVSGLL